MAARERYRHLPYVDQLYFSQLKQTDFEKEERVQPDQDQKSGLELNVTIDSCFTENVRGFEFAFDGGHG